MPECSCLACWASCRWPWGCRGARCGCGAGELLWSIRLLRREQTRAAEHERRGVCEWLRPDAPWKGRGTGRGAPARWIDRLSAPRVVLCRRPACGTCTKCPPGFCGARPHFLNRAPTTCRGGGSFPRDLTFDDRSTPAPDGGVVQPCPLSSSLSSDREVLCVRRIRARYSGYNWFQSNPLHFAPPRAAPTLSLPLSLSL